MKRRPFANPDVKAVFDGYTGKMAAKLLKLRDLIFTTASETSAVGDVVETLKWGQAAYLTERPRTGTTIRIDALRDRENTYAMFFHCQTNLIATFREIYSGTFAFEGNRAILFTLDDDVPEAALKHCVSLALTYHSRRAGAHAARI